MAPAMEEFNALVVAYFTGISQGLDFFAEGLETGDLTTQVVALANQGEVQQSFDARRDAQTGYFALRATCSGS